MSFSRGGGFPKNVGGTTSLLARTVYNPAGQTQYSVTSTTLVDIDAVNLAITFTVPTSGIVRIVLTARVVVGSGTELMWGLRSGTINIVGSDVCYSNLEFRAVAIYYVTGLTPGDVLTYKWAQGRPIGSNSAITRAGGDPFVSASQAIMEVWSI